MVAPIDSTNLEVGLVGNEGIVEITVILEVNTAPFTALVKGTGTALRITAPSFLRIFEQRLEVQHLLKR